MKHFQSLSRRDFWSLDDYVDACVILGLVDLLLSRGATRKEVDQVLRTHWLAEWRKFLKEAP